MAFSQASFRASTANYNPRQVAKAYDYPLQYTGKGYTCGIIELGGGFGNSDLSSYFTSLGLPVPAVNAIPVAGGTNTSDGPNGADGEVLLDIEVAGAIAPGATFNVYFAPNTDAGFLAAIDQAIADGVAVISISWGGPEDSWDPATIKNFDAAFAKARQAGIVVFAASGDSGSSDGEAGRHVDFPASSPNVIGCGGTRLIVNPDGTRRSEVVWDDSSRSATGGGVSSVFPGRQVPDVAGNADPQTGYKVLVDGQTYVIGGTSAVAPLYAGLVLLLSEAIGHPLGKVADFSNLLLTNLGVCFDVTSGNNGAYRAGPGRDDVTGLGVVDGGKLLAVLQSGGQLPAPVPGPTPAPVPTPSPTPVPVPPPVTTPADDADKTLWSVVKNWGAVKGLTF
jgi:kumamolisin